MIMDWTKVSPGVWRAEWGKQRCAVRRVFWPVYVWDAEVEGEPAGSGWSLGLRRAQFYADGCAFERSMANKIARSYAAATASGPLSDEAQDFFDRARSRFP